MTFVNIEGSSWSRRVNGSDPHKHARHHMITEAWTGHLLSMDKRPTNAKVKLGLQYHLLHQLISPISWYSIGCSEFFLEPCARKKIMVTSKFDVLVFTMQTKIFIWGYFGRILLLRAFLAKSTKAKKLFQSLENKMKGWLRSNLMF